MTKKVLRINGRVVDIGASVWATWAVVAGACAVLALFGEGHLVLGMPYWAWALGALGTAGAVRLYGTIDRREEGIVRYVFTICSLITLLSTLVCLAMTLTSENAAWTQVEDPSAVTLMAHAFAILGLVVCPIASLLAVGWLKLHRRAISA